MCYISLRCYIDDSMGNIYGDADKALGCLFKAHQLAFEAVEKEVEMRKYAHLLSCVVTFSRADV